MNSYNGHSPADRIKALKWLRAEQAQGRRPANPERCMGCGQTHGIIDFHSEDYSEPFGDNIGAFSFCFRCHMMIHCRFRSPTAWAEYLELLRKGATWLPLLKRNFYAITPFLNGARTPDSYGPPRPVLIFDSMRLRLRNESAAQKTFDLDLQ